MSLDEKWYEPREAASEEEEGSPNVTILGPKGLGDQGHEFNIQQQASLITKKMDKAKITFKQEKENCTANDAAMGLTEKFSSLHLQLKAGQIGKDKNEKSVTEEGQLMPQNKATKLLDLVLPSKTQGTTSGHDPQSSAYKSNKKNSEKSVAVAPSVQAAVSARLLQLPNKTALRSTGPVPHEPLPHKPLEYQKPKST